MNKGLEVIEAHFLFDIPFSNINVVIHPQSIINSLVEKNYPKIITKDTTASYDYLLGMDLYKLTSEEIEELKKKQEFKQTEYNVLFNKSSNDLWKEDINEFLTMYKRNLNDYEREHERGEISHKKQSKKPRLKK